VRQVAETLQTALRCVFDRATAPPSHPSGPLTPHCCTWLFCLLAGLEPVLALQASLASDLRFLCKLALIERSRLGASPDVAPEGVVAAVNVLLVVLTELNVASDLSPLVH
jgi:hypothetical protein